MPSHLNVNRPTVNTEPPPRRIEDVELLDGDTTENDLLESDLLVEEVSIDGMCGVY